MTIVYPEPQRLTKGARIAVEYARTEAETLRHSAIEPAHVLLGLLRESEGMAARILHDVGLTLDEARSVVAVSLRAATPGISSLSYTPAVQQVVTNALDEADQLKHHYCGTEHVLLGLLRTRDPQTTDIFARLTIAPAQIKIKYVVLSTMRSGYPR